MQTRKDLYQAHRLMQQRLGMALLQAEPDVPESPMRRHNVATFCGILLAVLVLAVFGIWGLISPGNATKLTEPGQLLVEEESGATYVWSESERRLLPVANYVSARLLLASADVKVRNVSAASLAEFARGPVVGIAGAPDSLPERERLVKSPWSVCVEQGPNDSGGQRPYVSLVGGTDVGGLPVGDHALVLTDGLQSWLIWAEHRMKISPTLANALTGTAPHPVPATWLNALPEAPAFEAPKIAQRGKRTTGPDGRRAAVGQVFTAPAVNGGSARWYVLLADGLAPVSPLRAELLLMDPASRSAYGTQPVMKIEIDAATANGAPVSRTVFGGPIHTQMPKMMEPGRNGTLCAVYSDTLNGSTRAKVTIGRTMPIPKPQSPGGDEHLDQVLLPPGSAAVAGLLPNNGQLTSISTFFLISDQGRSFALRSADQIEQLGYDRKDIAPLPAALLHLIPQGPALDPVAARSPLKTVQ